MSTGALAVLAPRPAAGSALTFLKFLTCSTNSAFSGHLLLGVFNPADELIARQRRDVLPSVKGLGTSDQRHAKVWRKFVHRPAGHSLVAHDARVVVRSGLGHHPPGRERQINDLT